MHSLTGYLLFILLSLQPFQSSFADTWPALSQGQSGLYGYVDEKGKYVIQPQYEKAFPFNGGVARVMSDNQWVLINDRGKRITKNAYHEIGEFRNGVAVVTLRETTRQSSALNGLINDKGQEVIKPLYPFFTPDPNHNVFILGKDGAAGKGGRSQIEFGVMNRKGEAVIPLRYTAIREQQFRVFAVKSGDDRWQAFNAAGQPLFNGSYSDIKDFDEELATVKKDGRWGILHASGREVVKPNYRSIVKRSRHNYELTGFTQWKVVNQKKETVLSLEYEDVQPVSPQLYSYRLEEKKGLLSEKGTPVTKPLYDQIHPFVREMAVVENDNLSGAINPKGVLFLPVRYQEISIDSVSSLLMVREKGKWGVFNRAGKNVVPVQYDEIRVQTYGMFTARNGNGWHLLDARGEPVNNTLYQQVEDFRFLHAVARSGGKAGLITVKGNWAIEPQYDSLSIISDFLVLHQMQGQQGLTALHTQKFILAVDTIEPVRNHFRVRIRGRQGVLNARGQEVIPVQYNYISDFSQDSILTVVQGKKRGLMNLKGRTILPPDALYQDLFVMNDQRVGVRINNKYGFVDDRGRLRIANRYEGIGTFSSGMAAVKIRGGWGYIDKDEVLRVQPHYLEALPFQGNAARVRRASGWGFVDRNGKETVRPQYDSVSRLPTGRYMVWKDGKKGLVNENGRELFGPRFDYLSDHDNGFVLLGRNGKLGLSDTGGFDVLPVIYDRLYFNSARNFYITGIEPRSEKFVYKP